ncbi:hypothetical protein Trydic_g10999 [Trypoxylus dichotomus]
MCKRIWVVWLYLFWYFFQASGKPLLQDIKVAPKKDVLDFMKRYGYLPPDTDTSAALYSEEGLSSVIKEIQKFGSIPQTGKLDNATLQLMSAPRCGVPDIQYKRSKRYAIGSKGWGRRNISYFIANWPHTVGEHKTKKDIKLALTTWGKYGRLRFEELDGPHADIVVAFAREYHGDSFPFDGQGSILAHAFFPREYQHLAGDVHFDADENWTAEPSDEGIYFYGVALHELGHSLGLAHSTATSSIMFPYYRADNSDLNLDYDDILGIYELYIRGGPADEYPYVPEIDDDRWSSTIKPVDRYTTPSSLPITEINNVTIVYEGDVETIDDNRTDITTFSTPTIDSFHPPDICEGNFDAAAVLREELFIFKDKYVWRLKEKNVIEKNYPVPIKQMFAKLPSYVKRIDAAYERPDGMIILFAGPEVWVYDGYEFIENSPRPLSAYGLPHSLDKIDAVHIWDKNGKTYLYKGDYFWRYNETSKAMDPGYPMDMSRWRGVPSYLDAAITWKDGVTYFFKGKEFWKFDNIWVIVTDTSPMPIPQIWLGCPKEIDLS